MMIRTNDPIRVSHETKPFYGMADLQFPSSMPLLSSEPAAAFPSGADAIGRLPLLPLQEKAVRETSLMHGGNVVIFAPTSSGKTAIAEMAMVRQIGRGKKAVFLSPTRALAHEKFQEFVSAYGDGSSPLRVVLATREFGFNDHLIRNGDFDIAVTVYEKFRGFMDVSPWFYDELGCVVADELQIAGDVNRGEGVDRLLSRLAATNCIQIVGLSAVLEDSARIAEWLNAEALVWNQAATELHEGVFCHETGGFHYTGRMTGESGVERGWDWEIEPGKMPVPSSEHPLRFENTVNLCRHFARRGEQTIVFVPTRRMCRDWALTLAQELGLKDNGPVSPPPYGVLEAGSLRTSLEQCFTAGVGFHCADLTSSARAAVEKGFRDGLFKILVATPTLAQGMNLHARNVIQVSLTAEELRSNPKLPALTVERYKNQAGRAGRLGTACGNGGSDLARSILIADSKAEAENLWAAFVDGAVPPLNLSPTDEGLEHFILDCLQDGRAKRYSSLHGELRNSLWWGRAEQRLDQGLHRCIALLLKDGLIAESENHDLELTAAGGLMLRHGISADIVKKLLAVCKEFPTDHIPTPTEILWVCAMLSDGENFHAVSLSAKEKSSRVWLNRLQTVYGDDMRDWCEYSRSLFFRGSGKTQTHRAVKAVLLARAWIGNTPTAELEENFHISAGTFTTLSEHLCRFVAALGAFAYQLRPEGFMPVECRRLTVRLNHGVADNCVEIAAADIPGLTRDFLHGLRRDGFETPAALIGVRPGTLCHVLPAELEARVIDFVRTTPIQNFDGSATVGLYPECDRARYALLPDDSVSGDAGEKAEMEELKRCAAEIRESFGNCGADKGSETGKLVFEEGHPGWVSFHGKRIRLTPKPYQLLVLLAKHPGETVTYADIDSSIWPDEKVEPQQISAHKNTILREFGRAAGDDAAKDLIVTDSRFGLRLNVSKGNVRFIPRYRQDGGEKSGLTAPVTIF